MSEEELRAVAAATTTAAAAVPAAAAINEHPAAASLPLLRCIHNVTTLAGHVPGGGNQRPRRRPW